MANGCHVSLAGCQTCVHSMLVRCSNPACIYNACLHPQARTLNGQGAASGSLLEAGAPPAASGPSMIGGAPAAAAAWQQAKAHGASFVDRVSQVTADVKAQAAQASAHAAEEAKARAAVASTAAALASAGSGRGGGREGFSLGGGAGSVRRAPRKIGPFTTGGGDDDDQWGPAAIMGPGGRDLQWEQLSDVASFDRCAHIVGNITCSYGSQALPLFLLEK